MKKLLIPLILSLAPVCFCGVVWGYNTDEDSYSRNRGMAYINNAYPRTVVGKPQPLFGGQPAVGNDRRLQETTSEKLLNSTNALYSLGQYFSESKQGQLLNEQIKEQKLRNKILEEQLKYKQVNGKK